MKSLHIFIYLYINLLLFIYLLYFNQFPLLWSWYESWHETSETGRSVKLKDMNTEMFPFMSLSCGLGDRRTSALQGFHIAVVTCNCGIPSKSRVHPPGNTPCIPHYKPHHTLISTIMHHYPCLADVRTPFLLAVLHGINPSLPSESLT